VLMQKERSFQEVYNDIDGDIVNLFRVVRNPEQCAELIRLLELTPYARDEWKYCLNNYETETNPIERARMVYYILISSFVGSLRNSGFSQGGVNYESSPARNFENSLKRLPAVAQRFKNVVIENKPAVELCVKWDSPDTLFYIDPPYLPETRRSFYDYKNEMNLADHQALLDWCLQAKGKIILSGYDSSFYQVVLENAGWVTHRQKAKCTIGSLSGTDTGTMDRTETLWLSPNAATKLKHNLFS